MFFVIICIFGYNFRMWLLVIVCVMSLVKNCNLWWVNFIFENILYKYYIIKNGFLFMLLIFCLFICF